MNNEMNSPEEVGSLYTNDIQKDDSIDIASLVKKARKDDETEKVTGEVVNNTTVNKKLSPLQQLQLQKEKEGTGIEVTKEELEAGKETTEFKNYAFNDERMNSLEQRVNDMDDTLTKRKAVVLIKEAKTSQEWSQLIFEIDTVKFDENGKAYFDYKDDDGNNIIPQYVRLRTENDPVFDKEKDKLLLDGAEPEKVKSGEITNETVKEEKNEDKEVDEEKNKIVKVLVDKTGLGIDFMFTEEEKEKLYSSQEIHLTEVEVLDIATIKTKRTEKSFQETVREQELSNSKTTICFPCSGFRAQMKGMTYGEMADVALSMDAVTFDKYYKRMTVIYNKMSNISTGPFESFEKFLKEFAYVDIEMALYGLYISTQPEIQQLELRCGNAECKKTFDWTFNTRSVLRLEKCTQKYLDNMKTIANAPASEYDNIKANSPVMQSKYIKLPYSGYIIEMGTISAYEFLYNVVPMMDEKTFAEAFGENTNEINVENTLLLLVVRSIRVPDENGDYDLYEGYKDLIDALGTIKPEEIKIILSLYNKFIEEYQVSFSFGDVKCPHCGIVTENLDLKMDDLVFQTYQRLRSTEINVESIQGL